MTEKRISDLAIGLTVGLFVLAIFSYAVIDMDDNTNNNELKNINMKGDYDTLQSNDLDSNNRVYTSLFNTSSFVVTQNSYIDTRGQGESNIIAQDKDSTIKGFFNNINLTKWDYHGRIIALILVLIGIVTGVLLLRSMLGSNRV